MKFKLLLQLSHIIKKMGIRDEMIDFITKAKDKGENAETLGLTLIMLLFENIALAEKELYEFVGELTGIEDIPNADMAEVINAIIKAFKEVDVKSFFSQLSSLTK